MANIFSAMANVPNRMSTAVYRCRACGAMAFNVSFIAFPRDEYGIDTDGRVRRRFDFVGGNPVCDCTQSIWLSDEDVGYLVLESAELGKRHD